MNETLRPSTLGEILDRTVQLYRRNFWVFAGVSALPIGVMVAIAMLAGFGAVIAGVAARGARGVDFLPGLEVGGFVLVAIPAYIAAYVFSMAGLTQAAASAHRGEKQTIRAALKSVGPDFWRYLWFLVLQGILVALIPIAIAGAVAGPLIYFASRAGAGIAAGAAIGFVIFVVVAAALGAIFWLALSYAMGLAVCVVEQKSAWQSLQRSWKLSRGTRGRIFVLFLLIGVLAMVVSMIGYIPALIIAGVTTAAGNGAANATTALIAAELVQFLVNFCAQTLLAPVSWIALVLFYYDQRIRTEGYDIEWMMEQAGMTQFASQAPAYGSEIISGPAQSPDTVEER